MLKNAELSGLQIPVSRCHQSILILAPIGFYKSAALNLCTNCSAMTVCAQTPERRGKQHRRRRIRSGFRTSNNDTNGLCTFNTLARFRIERSWSSWTDWLTLYVFYRSWWPWSPWFLYFQCCTNLLILFLPIFKLEEYLAHNLSGETFEYYCKIFYTLLLLNHSSCMHNTQSVPEKRSIAIELLKSRLPIDVYQATRTLPAFVHTIYMLSFWTSCMMNQINKRKSSKGVEYLTEIIVYVN